MSNSENQVPQSSLTKAKKKTSAAKVIDRPEVLQVETVAPSDQLDLGLESSQTVATPSDVDSIRETIDATLSLGLPPIPTAPYQDPHQYPKKINKDGKWVIDYEDDGITPKPLFSGKNPSYLDLQGRPQTIKHSDYQKTQPSQSDIKKWWSNPLNGVGSLGSENHIWLDFDVKDFDSQADCDEQFNAWLDRYPQIKEAWIENSGSGGYRVLVQVKAKKTFTNFSLEPDGIHRGEALGSGRYAVLAPTKGTNPSQHKDYTLLQNRGCVVEVDSLEAIGIYKGSSSKKSKSTKTKKTSTSSLLFIPVADPTVNPDLYPIALLDLLSKTTQEIMEPGADIPDRSYAMTTCIKEIYGWSNWLTQNGIVFSPSVEAVYEAAVIATGTDDKKDRVIGGINLGNLVPACFNASGSDVGCWQQVKRVHLETYEAKCPVEFKALVEVKEAEYLAANNIIPRKPTALEAAKNGLPLPITVTPKKSGGYKLSLPGEVDTARYINISSQGRLCWHPTEKRFYAYNSKGGYWEYADEVTLKRMTSAVIENSDEGDATGYLNFSYIPQVVKSLNIHSGDVPATSDITIIPFDGKWFDSQTKTWVEPSKEVFVTAPLPIAPMSGDFSRMSDWLMKAVKGDRGNYDLLRCLFWLVLHGLEKQVYFEIVGYAGTGKGVLFRLLTKMVGKANSVSTDLSTLAGSRFAMATLHRKRLILLPDQKSYSGSCDSLKRMTGEDALPLEYKGDPTIGNFTVNGIVVISANDFLRFTDEADALDRRRIPIKFDVKATKDELLAHTNFEGYLCEALPQWIDHIINLDRDWVYRTLENRKELTHDARLEQLLEANPMAQWLSDCVAIVKDAKTPVGDMKTYGSLYHSYHEYCELHGLFSLSTTKFRGDLERQLETVLGWSKAEVHFKKTNAGQVGLGLGLRDVHIGTGFDPVTREPHSNIEPESDPEF
jgi:hypothetical protein